MWRVFRLYHDGITRIVSDNNDVPSDVLINITCDLYRSCDNYTCTESTDEDLNLLIKFPHNKLKLKT